MPPFALTARRLLALLAAMVVGLFGALMMSSPASAHDALIKGEAACQSDGTYTVTWTITNDWTTPLSIVQPSATPVALQGNVDAIGSKDSATATQVGVPASADKATLAFKAVWSQDNYNRQKSGEVSLDGSCQTTPDCVSAADAHYSHTFDGPKGTATVSLADGQKLCADSSQDFSLASYTAQSAEWSTSFPQKLFDQDSKTVDSEHTSVTLTVDVPNCFTQVDLVWGGKDQVLPGFDQGTPTYGNKILGSKGAPGNQSEGPRGSWAGGNGPCTVSSPSESPSESPVPSATVAPASTSPAASGGLPVTGTSLTAFVVAAVVLIGGGLTLFIVARKRRATPAGQ
ncbi:MAG: hypothetical protein WCA46_16395 [Actinocatenispora sp.]